MCVFLKDVLTYEHLHGDKAEGRELSQGIRKSVLKKDGQEDRLP